jgi:hypothetical protein
VAAAAVALLSFMSLEKTAITARAVPSWHCYCAVMCTDIQQYASWYGTAAALPVPALLSNHSLHDGNIHAALPHTTTMLAVWQPLPRH